MSLAPANPAHPIDYPTPEARRHFFAVCRDAHANLPAGWSEHFPAERSLRQHALIRAGFCTHTDIIFRSPEAAVEASLQVRPSKGQSYACVVLNGDVLSILEARSQSAKALPAAEFYDLRSRVFAILAEMIGVDPVTLRDRAGRAA